MWNQTGIGLQTELYYKDIGQVGWQGYNVSMPLKKRPGQQQLLQCIQAGVMQVAKY